MPLRRAAAMTWSMRAKKCLEEMRATPKWRREFVSRRAAVSESK
jgi:hypothetical protein